METGAQETALYLIGFRVEPDIYAPQLYTIYVGGDRPIMRDGQPIVFARADLATSALNKSDCGASKIGPAPTELHTVFDITDAVYTLNMKDEAPDSGLLDFVNVLLDFANCIEEPMPEQYRSALSMLADHLTFNLRFAEFLGSHQLGRKTITDAVFWTLGMIAYYMKVIVD